MTLSFAQICRRVGGRRRYNLHRAREAEARREKVSRLLDEYGRRRRGVQARIARELGVSRATVCRDASFIELLREIEELD